MHHTVYEQPSDRTLRDQLLILAGAHIMRLCLLSYKPIDISKDTDVELAEYVGSVVDDYIKHGLNPIFFTKHLENHLYERYPIDISVFSLRLEDIHLDTEYETVTLYFVNSRKLIETDHVKISIEFPINNPEPKFASAMISPIKDGLAYDWSDLKLSYENIAKLIDIYLKGETNHE